MGDVGTEAQDDSEAKGGLHCKGSINALGVVSARMFGRFRGLCESCGSVQTGASFPLYTFRRRRLAPRSLCQTGSGPFLDGCNDFLGQFRQFHLAVHCGVMN